MSSNARTVLVIVAITAGLISPVHAQTPAPQPRPLAVVNTGPSGELGNLAEANEIRIVFSEPMVTVGLIG
jgi:hypothetical protein